MRSLANTLIKTFRENELTIALAESMTCGLAAHQLSTVKGTSDVLRGSIVCYHPDVKTDLIGVSNSLIKKYSAESQQVTDELAKKLKKLIDADFHAAITGLASGGSSEEKGKPPGTVFFTVIYKGKVHRERKVFRGTPLQIRKRSCVQLYEMLLEISGKRKVKE
jgi:nicotinamide-nucleotide amidase